MIVCPGCGFEAPDDSAFCSKCGIKLAAPLSVPEELKVVTSLFCDLVAFTAMSEAADPEDVDAVLRRYSEVARRVVESHGGTVEKFIGDAVVGLFGVPASHEDDPERAVRAGLRLVEALEGLERPDGTPLQVRVGVNTGEALVRLDVTPGSGEGFLTGDAVNVAARLESAAPPMGVVAGQLTHELTQRVIVYEELPFVVAKGKAEPVAAWLATAPVARRGLDSDAGELTPLVGREAELSYLSAIFDKAVAQSTPQFALLVGEPGIGKSRLVRELSVLVDARPQMTTWRQGYCPPFGEDVTYWALSEIIKGHAGIRDTDEPAGVEAKLDAVLPLSSEREWFRQRLRVLVGLNAPDASRDENFTAWMRFFEGVAARRPTVLVFEDLHWADDALLAFLEHMATHLASVPLMMVGTARPELFERQPTFAAGSRVSRLGVEPLTSEETARLVSPLLGDLGDSAVTVAQVVERCDGNPFYAEQSARLLTDASRETPLPGSVQAVIAARLDVLPMEQKALLGDAAVVGSVFWDGVLAAMGGHEPQELQGMLSDLLERQLIRRIRESSMADEREFAFVHALAREVAYRQLPRTARARRHADAASWLEAKAAGQPEDFAALIAHHFATALELARAAGRGDLADSLTEQAVKYLTLAGDRSLQLDVASAARQYRRALDLLPAHDRQRPALLLKRGEALRQLGDFQPAADVLAEAVTGFREAGAGRASAVVMMHQASALLMLGNPTATTIAAGALALLEADGPSSELVFGLEWLANFRVVSSDYRLALDLAERAIAMAEQLGLPEPIGALEYRGIARSSLGDASGLADVQRALTAAQEGGSATLVATIHFNLGDTFWLLEGAAAVLDIRRKGLAFAERRGQKSLACTSCAGLASDLIWAGDWDEALALSLETEPMLETMGDVYWLLYLRCGRALLHALRGEAEAAQPMAARADEQIRVSREHEGLVEATLAQAAVEGARRDAAGTRTALTTYEVLVQRHVDADYALRLPLAVRLAVGAGDVPLAEALAAHVEPSLPLYQHALASAQASLAEARGEQTAAAVGFAAAAAAWHDFGVPYEEAQALLGQGRCLVAIGRAPEAAQPLREAREFFARLGAKPALVEVDQLLSGITAAPL